MASCFADRPVAVRPQPVGACRWARLRPRTWTGGHEARPSTFLAIQEDILLRMEDIINAAGSGFAFPSQTAYLARDGGLEDERGISRVTVCVVAADGVSGEQLSSAQE